MSVKPNRHFQEVVGYTALKLWSDFRSADRCLGVIVQMTVKTVCVCWKEIHQVRGKVQSGYPKKYPHYVGVEAVGG